MKVTIPEAINYVKGRGYQAERIFNDREENAAIRTMGLKLTGPRRNKITIVAEDDLIDLDSAKLWCDGVDYATKQIAERKFRKANLRVLVQGKIGNTHVTIKSLKHNLGATVCDPVVCTSRARLRVTGNLSGRLAKLVPPTWGNAPLEAWTSFVQTAIAMGML